MAMLLASAFTDVFDAAFFHGVVYSLTFGFLGILLLIAGYWLFELLTPRLNVQKELAEKNMAVSLVIAALLLGIAYIIAHVVQ